MKLIVIPFMLFFSSVTAQEYIFTDADKVPDCKTLKNGKFESTIHSPNDYYMIVKDGFQTEFVSGGKYFVKSKMEFIDECTYKSTVVEVTIPEYNVRPGEFAITEILSTQREFIKIKTKMGDKELISVLKKVIITH